MLIFFAIFAVQSCSSSDEPTKPECPKEAIGLRARYNGAFAAGAAQIALETPPGSLWHPQIALEAPNHSGERRSPSPRAASAAPRPAIYLLFVANTKETGHSRAARDAATAAL